MSLSLPSITVSGTARQMGEAHGEACREQIRAFVRERLRAARVYLHAHGAADGVERLLRAAKSCLAASAGWDAAGEAEQAGIAHAAGVDPVELFATGNMTDVRDLVLYAASPDPAAEGCTSLLLHPVQSADGALIAAQTWDLNPGDIDYVLGIHRQPSEGPETWSVTCCGCLSLVGMNGDGVWAGTTNIKLHDTRPGVCYLQLLHRALASPDAEAAARAIIEAPRAAAHTYWLADGHTGIGLECSATRHRRRDLSDAGLCQTNHCLDPVQAPQQAEAISTSSATRLHRCQEFLQAGPHDLDSIKRLFADRGDGVDSINRYPEDGQGTATNSCLIAIPARRLLFACRGPADRGIWTQLSFT